jgi:low temperature requirement protein LtrA
MPENTNAHRLARMTGRDPAQNHRTATPLELLFDLTFVIAIGQASGEFAHLVAEAHFGAALAAFGFAVFAIVWAWINFTWFASAYDTDDWFYRVTTMVQMIGVIIVALGVPALFHSIDEGAHLDNQVIVIGYVVMRVALVLQWLRAAKQDPERRATALSYATFVSIAQIGWLVVAFTHLDLAPTLAIAAVLFGVELAGPILAERKTEGTPWHPHHIAERFGLLAIITLGEGIFGTVATVSAYVEEHEWTMDAVLILVAGIGLTFGLWWNYFLIPSGPVLAKFRAKSWVWGYGHIVIFGSIAATGAGLHVAAYVIEGHSELGNVGAVLAVAIPVFLFGAALFALYAFLVGEFDPFHIGLMVGLTAVLVVAVALAAAGASIGLCLLVVTLAPAVVVVGYETIGHRHEARFMARLEA